MNLAKPINPKTKIKISFKPVFDYLYSVLSPYESQLEYSYAILHHLCDEALSYSDHWVQSNGVEDAVSSIDAVVPTDNHSFAYDVCRNASMMIYQIITEQIPDYGSNKYAGKVLHKPRNNYDVILEIESNVLGFCI